MILFLTLGIVVGVAAHAATNTARLKATLQAKAVKKHFPLAMQALVIVAQTGELVNVIHHIDPVNITAALLLLAILVATRSGTETSIE